MRLSNQALGAIMLALQESLMSQTDIVPVLKSFDLELDESLDELVVKNPPTLDLSKSVDVDYSELQIEEE